jgi:hypothetical protein
MTLKILRNPESLVLVWWSNEFLMVGCGSGAVIGTKFAIGMPTIL